MTIQIELIFLYCIQAGKEIKTQFKIQKGITTMKKYNAVIATIILCLGLLLGCELRDNETSNVTAQSQMSERGMQEKISNTYSYSDAYDKIISFKLDDYTLKSVADFNQLLTPDDGDLTEILNAYSTVLASISENDKNYSFIKVTLTASLDELYCEQLGEEITFNGAIKKHARPIKPLNEEEKQFMEDEPTYEFYFTAFYNIQYTIDAETLTISQRDQTLQAFHTKLQSYVDRLSEDQLTSGDIRKVLSNKAKEIADRLSSKELELACKISNIEVHNSGVDTQK